MRITTLSLLLAIALLAAACGGTDDLSTDDLTVDQTALDDIDVDDAADQASDAAAGVVSEIDQAGCEDAATALETVPGDVADIATGQGDPAALETSLADFQAVADNAPADIAGDMDTIATTFTDIAATLQELDLQAGTLPGPDEQQEIAGAIGTLTGQAFTDATTTVSTWFAEGCPA
jgi:hypothetical protein